MLDWCGRAFMFFFWWCWGKQKKKDSSCGKYLRRRKIEAVVGKAVGRKHKKGRSKKNKNAECEKTISKTPDPKKVAQAREGCLSKDAKQKKDGKGQSSSGKKSVLAVARAKKKKNSSIVFFFPFFLSLPPLLRPLPSPPAWLGPFHALAFRFTSLHLTSPHFTSLHRDSPTPVNR